MRMDSFVIQLPENKQNRIERLLREELSKLDLQENELETYVEKAMNSRVSDLTDTLDRDELTDILNERNREVRGVILEGSETVGTFDVYDFTKKTAMSTQDISVVVDFSEEEITGTKVAYGEWVDLELDEALEYLDQLKEDEILRDFSSVKNNVAEVSINRLNKNDDKDLEM